MNEYREIFKKKNTLLVVIHAESKEQVVRNLDICWQKNVDGVFLINHTMSPESLNAIFNYVYSGDWFKDKWVGLNMLGLDSNTALRTVPNTASGLWVDNACIGDDGVSIAGCNWKIRNEEKVDWPGLYFGGVAFKYQAPVKHLFAISKAATTCMDVITTSGIATGVPPDIEKIKTMRSAIGDFPLAVASGITPENVEPYRDLADCFLVATGISHSHTELDPKRVEMMVNAMNK